ncbi:aromatic amino acid transport family protein [Helicobacter cetorum]|uniref:aromatic amino acid transport family protein n=1 Tax=Helicobacter cetorum TaxID=138563 RepID=UPI000CF12D59|nr:aromatic amino acid transport family protein [Helicobacter cetorum]
MKENTTPKNYKKLNAFDIRWIASLFGTAVGAGILFLPIKAGGHGIWVIIAMFAIIFPLTWLGHRALAYFIGSRNGEDITMVARSHFGTKWGFAITLLYFFAIYPICLAYGVGITNVFDNFFINQLHLEPFNRGLLAFVLVSLMMIVMTFNATIVTRICNALVYPLCLILLLFSVYLMPYWQFSNLFVVPSFKEFILAIWLTLPVLVFSFNHSPIISTFTQNVEKEYGAFKEYKLNQIELGASLMLLGFVMFFVLSCIMCLNADDFIKAKEQNIPILSYFANTLNNPLINYAGPIVAFLAIFSSFLGHYYGAKEGLEGIIIQGLKLKKPSKALGISTTIFLWLTITLVAYINPNILDFIENLGGPIIALILFVMPMIAFYTIPTLKRFRNLKADIFVFVLGSLSALSVFLGLF